MSVFSQKVYSTISRIPKGFVVTYTDVAVAIGSPKAVRAVGTALGNNPSIPIIPCHRVVRSDGTMGGYANGIDKKIVLLKKEGVVVYKGVVDLDYYRYIL